MPTSLCKLSQGSPSRNNVILRSLTATYNPIFDSKQINDYRDFCLQSLSSAGKSIWLTSRGSQVRTLQGLRNAREASVTQTFLSLTANMESTSQGGVGTTARVVLSVVIGELAIIGQSDGLLTRRLSVRTRHSPQPSEVSRTNMYTKENFYVDLL